MLSTQWIGEFGERYVKGVLQNRGYDVISLQNASGNGIDIVAIKHKFGRRLLLIVEVKSTSGSKPPKLSAKQKNLAEWARARLVAAANGLGTYGNLSSQDRDLARKLLKYIQQDIPAAAVVASVRGVRGRNVPTVKFDRWTRIPPRGIKGRPLTPAPGRRGRKSKRRGLIF